ncbi:hypothetical protein Tco_0584296 [Tanacetum coccineum]
MNYFKAVPKLISRIDSLETDLKQTKLTMGNAIVKLVKKMKKLEVNASGEEQVEDISPNTLEAAKTLSKVASLKPRSIDKGRRYKRIKEAKGKKVVSSLDFQEEVRLVQNKTKDKENPPMIRKTLLRNQKNKILQDKAIHLLKLALLNTGNEQVSTVGAKKSNFIQDKGQREGKAPMISEETPKKSKEQILQQEARHGSYSAEELSFEESQGMNLTSLLKQAMKTPSIATYKIIKQGEKGAYQIVREDGTDIVYINFGAMLKSISRRMILTELYRIVMNRYGMDGPEDKLEKIFWKYLKDMFEEPLSTDPVWSLLSQQRIISWRYYDTCRVHCLNLESMISYMFVCKKISFINLLRYVQTSLKMTSGWKDE